MDPQIKNLRYLYSDTNVYYSYGVVIIQITFIY